MKDTRRLRVSHLQPHRRVGLHDMAHILHQLAHCAADFLRANADVQATAAATELRRITDEIARAGGTPLAVAKDGRLLGAIFLKDVVKAGIRQSDAAPLAIIEFVDRDVSAKGQDSGPVMVDDEDDQLAA